MQSPVVVNPSQGVIPVIETSWQSLPDFNFDDLDVLCTPLDLTRKELTFLLWGVSTRYKKPVLIRTSQGGVPDQVISRLSYWSICNQVWNRAPIRSQWREGTVRAYNYRLDLTPGGRMSTNSAQGLESENRYMDLGMLEAAAYVAASHKSRLELLFIASTTETDEGLRVVASTVQGEEVFNLLVPNVVTNQTYTMATDGFLARRVGQKLLCEFNANAGVLEAVYY